MLNLRNQYFTPNILKSWHDAQTYCREKLTDLVTIKGERVNKAIPINPLSDWCWDWIGLYRIDSSQTKWSRRDEIANFTLWDKGKQG